ncbi:FAD-dependent oxidoreductase [Sphingomonas sp. MG17]|uniref:FAD-dependent oxidoreductase n=1 Tax=Sphingomonas tagetis TaxID=2949092 RepID=A0A9X2KNL6_9SPHN|nr:FAD-dependent oxidoreductase [Sphingomonas tagetis]MCP3729793.1 FAD-dependent oxidoreductase [Sphingomonas tagetis]
MSGRDIIVIGAGVVGMATALTLVDRGHRVTVLDSAPEPGRGTSFANGAQLSYAYTDALASPAVRRQLPRLLLALDPAFRLTPHFDPDFVRWGLAFLRNANADGFTRNTLAGLTLAFESREALYALIARHGLRFGHAMPGKLHLYRTEASFAAARILAALKAQAAPIVQHVLSAGEAVAVEPMLDAVRGRIAGALHTPEEETGDPHLFCMAVRDVLAGQGQQVVCGVEIVRIEAGGSPRAIARDGRVWRADRIILCAGVDSPKLARAFGVRLPIQPVKGYSITARPGPSAPGVSITDVANRVVFCRLGERMRIAGLAELGNRSRDVDPARLATLIASAREALPDAAHYDQIESSWTGLRPTTPDSLPVTRPIAPGVIANTGHGGLGWTYAAGSAARVARLIEEKH